MINHNCISERHWQLIQMKFDKYHREMLWKNMKLKF